MVSLNKLRTKFGIVLSIIIALALLAFILSLKTEMGFSGNDPKVGVIDGEKIHYSEYYQNAFSDIYKGKQGYLYECDDIPSVGNPTQINGVFVCENAVKVDRVTMIPDLCDRLMEYQQQGLFRIRPLDTISDKEMQSVYDDLKQTIQKYNLKQFPDNSMSRFLRKHFPEVWEKE